MTSVMPVLATVLPVSWPPTLSCLGPQRCRVAVRTIPAAGPRAELLSFKGISFHGPVLSFSLAVLCRTSVRILDHTGVPVRLGPCFGSSPVGADRRLQNRRSQSPKSRRLQSPVGDAVELSLGLVYLSFAGL